MPELPEIEVLVHHLRPALVGRRIQGVAVRRAKVLRPDTPRTFRRGLLGATFSDVSRRGKYLLFQLRPRPRGKPFFMLGHLGMAGRMFLAAKTASLPRHAAVVLDLGAVNFIYEDTRYFGRMNLDLSPVATLGPEPLNGEFSPEMFWASLRHSRQAVKVRLLDQSRLAGLGNIYASEALFRAGIPPRLPANRVNVAQARRLLRAIRAVLQEAIECGSTVPLNFGADRTDGLFYFGRAPGAPDFYDERLRVYDRAGKPCANCGRAIKRIVQAGRSTFYCPRCQKAHE